MIPRSGKEGGSSGNRETTMEKMEALVGNRKAGEKGGKGGAQGGSNCEEERKGR